VGARGDDGGVAGGVFAAGVARGADGSGDGAAGIEAVVNGQGSGVRGQGPEKTGEEAGPFRQGRSLRSSEGGGQVREKEQCGKEGVAINEAPNRRLESKPSAKIRVLRRAGFRDQSQLASIPFRIAPSELPGPSVVSGPGIQRLAGLVRGFL
jgi:hypothetical protein